MLLNVSILENSKSPGDIMKMWAIRDLSASASVLRTSCKKRCISSDWSEWKGCSLSAWHHLNIGQIILEASLSFEALVALMIALLANTFLRLLASDLSALISF